MIITILLLNLIFGIILDTFSSMRERASDQLEKRSNRCIICGLQRQRFEVFNDIGSHCGGWEKHYKEEHNVWHYFFFVVHLRTKQYTEFTGIEKEVNDMILKSNLSWIPRNKAISANNEDSDDEEFDAISQRLDKLDTAVRSIEVSVGTGGVMRPTVQSQLDAIYRRIRDGNLKDFKETKEDALDGKDDNSSSRNASSSLSQEKSTSIRDTPRSNDHSRFRAYQVGN